MIGLSGLKVGFEDEVGEEAGDVLQFLPLVLLLCGKQHAFEDFLTWRGLVVFLSLEEAVLARAVPEKPLAYAVDG
ncbi:hypothetical protein D3C80_2083580 [compost metagenome]